MWGEIKTVNNKHVNMNSATAIHHQSASVHTYIIITMLIFWPTSSVQFKCPYNYVLDRTVVMYEMASCGCIVK